MAVSVGFKLYVSYFGNYNETYGTLGTFIVVLTWFYLTGFAILVGAEVNSEIEHASPKVPAASLPPGRAKKIGVLARREYERFKARSRRMRLKLLYRG